MSFFDDSHVTDVGLQGSAGPSVGFTEMVSQGFRQQFRVDSARALDDELRNRWLESLRAAQITDQINSVPDPLGRNPSVDPDDPWAYRAFAQHISGQPVDTFDPNKTLGGYDPTARLRGMIDANEKIKQLNNPNIKTFEQILEEVSQMQHEVEGETASMYERSGTGGWAASLLGAIGGSFTTRDPLNIITAPIGAGRTVATRIASEMGIAAAVVGYTELADVAPARKTVGLPERDPLFNIAAATLGAGVIRGGFEGAGYGLRRLRSEDIDFDLRDSQLAQMFEANNVRPSARAGLKLLDDTQFIERNNPYGEGRAAQARFIAELQQIQRVMGGEPMTAVARVLPPMPYESIKKAADFEIVKEQAPQVYARMEAAQAKLVNLTRQLDEFSTVIKDQKGSPITFYRGTTNLDMSSRESRFTFFSTDPKFAARFTESSKGGSISSANIKAENVGDFRNPEHVAQVKQLIVDKFNKEGRDVPTEWFDAVEKGEWGVWERKWILDHFGWDAVWITEKGVVNLAVRSTDQVISDTNSVTARNSRQAANAEYQAAYREVEAEAIRIRDQQALVEAAQQREAVGIFAEATVGRPFNWSALQYDSVQARVDAINAFNDTLDEATVARFVRETVSEGEEAAEREAWRTDEGIDIGLKDPIDPEFRISTDDGDMSVEAAMRDLQDDADLDDAMRTCLL